MSQCWAHQRRWKWDWQPCTKNMQATLFSEQRWMTQPVGMFCLAHRHFLGLQLANWWAFKTGIFHIKICISGSSWRISRHNSTSLGLHMAKLEQSNSSFPPWKRHVLSPCTSLPSLQRTGTGAWWWSPIHSFTSLLWSLRSTFVCFAPDSIKFYSWVNSDHQRAAVLDHTVLAHCKISFTESYAGIMPSLSTFAVINCLYEC